MPTKKPKAKKYINPDDFYIARRRAGLTIEMAADMLDVTVKTIKNWEGHQSPIPYASFRLMRLAGGYNLIDKGWEGWAIWQGKLYSPSGRSFEPHELNYLANYMQMARFFIKDRQDQSATADRQRALRSRIATDMANDEHVTNQRDEASCATAQAGARPHHDANVITVDFSRQKGGSRKVKL